MSLFRSSGRLVWWLEFGILAILLLVLLTASASMAYDGIAGRWTAQPTTPIRAIPNTDVDPLGANFFLAREVEPWKLDKTLHMAASAGVTWAKVHFPWEEIEPLRKGEFLDPATKTDSWAKYDRLVDACEKYELRIVARLDRPPDWTRQDNSYKQRPPDDLDDYGNFVYAFVEHYKDRIDYIQIWNEPNIFPEWGNRAVDPEGYVELLRTAYMRAKEANPNIYVLNAPLAITLGQRHPEPDRWISMSDLMYLERMYEAGAGEYFDIYSANAFGMDRPPEDPPDPEVLNFQRILLQRRIMERYNDKDKAVWFNEYGWNAAPASMPLDRLTWRRVTEKEQAEYTLRGIQLAREEWPWAGVFMIWYFRQVGHIPVDRADYYFRMVDPDFTPRMLYFAVQDMAESEPPPGPGTYQETNPFIKRFGRWHNVLDDLASGGAYIHSETPGDSIAFAFNGTAVDLVTHRWQGSGRLLVSLDGHSIPGLPVDQEGRSIIDLYSPSLQPNARVPLSRELASGEHTLRLTVDSESHADATGRECILDAFEILGADEPVVPVLPLALAAIGLGLDVWLLSRTWRRLRWAVRPS